MSYKETLDWLHRYRDSLRRQQVLGQELAQLRAMAEGLTRSPDSVPGCGGPGDRLPCAVGQLVEAQARLEEQVAVCLRQRGEVLAAIHTVGDARMREVLRRRHILGEKFEAIAAEMHLDLRWVYRLHRRAVQSVTLPQIDQ